MIRLFSIPVLFILAEIILGTFGAGCIQAQELSYSGNAQFATGSYFFTEKTESFSISNGLNLSAGKVRISFTVPFITQNSPWVSYGAAGYIPTGGPDHKMVRDSTGKGSGGGGKGSGSGNGMMGTSDFGPFGSMASNQEIPLPDTSSYSQSSFGDPSIYANVKLYNSETGSTSLQLNTGIKLPLADPNSGFGTGEWDYGFGLSGSQRIGKLLLIVDLMKWQFGDLPDLELKDPLAYSAGLGWSISPKWLVNTSFNGYTEIIENVDPPMSVGIGIGHFISSKASLNGSAFWGLSESSADFSIGVGWNIRLY